ncbi:STAS/SEC14 domain-containing protein [Sphingomonas sp. G-3-2-10]|uniref:STAS/SEC14 domain-containing protein n=1 Tax=Sphingomonas sp. G-3-2-10 TaxID=2728838 RepID=UPI00146BC9E4|nr:STAS/SEC14 domain-containing protein [Sphingomonas sp. G-3-2-10]NML07683.1 STAS/SEC14 domain-containing protein [Sphingomonas sp. G-3-2-10]
MSAHFQIEADPARDLIRIRMGGFFTPADITAFLQAREEAHEKLTCGRNRHVTLNDVRDMKIQSQEAVDSFRAMLSQPSHASRRLAFVVSPTLARSQLMRAIDARHARLFEDPASAEAWLFSADADARAA